MTMNYRRILPLFFAVLFVFSGSNFAYATHDGANPSLNESVHTILEENPNTVTIVASEYQLIANMVENGVISHAELNDRLAELSSKSAAELSEDGYSMEQIEALHDYTDGIDALDYLHSTDTGATVYFSFLANSVVESIRFELVYEITWSSAPICKVTDSYGLGWYPYDYSNNPCGIVKVGHISSVEYCMSNGTVIATETPEISNEGNSGIVGTFDMEKSIYSINATLTGYAKRISGVITLQTGDLSPTLNYVEVYASYAHTYIVPEVEVSFSLSLSATPFGLNFTPGAPEYQTMLVDEDRTFDFLPSGNNDEEDFK